MFKLSRTKTFIRLAVIGAIAALASIAAVILAINRQDDSNATSQAGQDATIDYIHSHGSIRYGDPNSEEQARGQGYTRYYQITTSEGTFDGYCAEPKDNDPLGEGKVHKPDQSDIKIKKMKLLIYIREHNNSSTSSLRSQIFDSVSNDDYWTSGGASSSTLRIYTFTHATLGKIYQDAYTAINDDSERAKIENAINIVTQSISDDSQAWKNAQKYTLFYSVPDNPTSGNPQRVVWIEENEPLGSIKIQKHDADTNSTTPQGNATFAGIHFGIYNNSGRSITYNNRTVADGALVVDGVTPASGTLTFNNLPADDVKYTVKELSSGTTNVTYQITNIDKTVTLSSDGQTVTTDFSNQVKRGKATFSKVDAETNSCTNTTSGMSLAGAKFQLINNSTNSIHYGSNDFAKGQVVATKTIDSDCKVSFDNLPYGSYILKETETSQGYTLADPVNFNIPGTNDSYNLNLTVKNQPIRGDLKFVKMDKDNNRPMDNTLFSISSIDSNYQVKETHIVITNQDGIVDTSASFIPHTRNTNGYDSLYGDYTDTPVVFAGYGTWFGLDKNGNNLAVNDNLGALPYGTYIIEELKCDANLFCSNIINQKITVKITEDKKVVDLGDWDNSCAKFSIETSATDNKDGDKLIEAGTNTVIKDTVSYCAKKNMEFTIKGILMDKATGEPLLIDGQTVEQSVTFTPTEDCGQLEMLYPLNSSDLAGKEIVVFESLYYKEDKLTEHADLTDANQTIDVIELKTYATNNETGEKTLPANLNVVIKDVVKYCLVPGQEYTLKGVIADKSTGSEISIDGAPVESTITFTPESTCGEVEMFFNLNTTGLDGADLVVFESLYFEDQLIIEHRDVNDEAQSLSVETPPVPETGFITKSSDGAQSAFSLNIMIGALIVIAPIGFYAISRHHAKQRFLK